MDLNYRWVNGTFNLEYEAVIGNGYKGSIASSTGAQSGTGTLGEDLGLGAAWKGRTLTLTFKVRRDAVLGNPPPLVQVTVWQSDRTGTLPGRINEQSVSEEGTFDADGFANFNAVITFD